MYGGACPTISKKKSYQISFSTRTIAGISLSSGACVSASLKRLVRFLLLLLMFVQGSFQEGLGIKVRPEACVRSAITRVELNKARKRLHGRADEFLDALRHMPLVLEMVLHAQDTVPQDRALSLSAWAMCVY